MSRITRRMLARALGRPACPFEGAGNVNIAALLNLGIPRTVPREARTREFLARLL
jgi:hypothetical protein